MKNNQKLGLKAFPSNKFKFDTEGSEHLLTMTNSYDISGHMTGREAQKQANRPHLVGQFPSANITKVLCILLRNFAQLIVTPSMV